jgi:hypothetical protein
MSNSHGVVTGTRGQAHDGLLKLNQRHAMAPQAMDGRQARQRRRACRWLSW